MRIRAYRYMLPLRAVTSSGTAMRNGFVIRVDGERRTGWGDVSPLDGYSPESFEQVKSALSDVLDTVTDGTEPRSFAKEYPSLASGVSFAVREALLKDDYSDRVIVPSACLIDERDDDAFLTSTARAVEEGFRCIKVKVGRRSVHEDIANVKRLQEFTLQHTTLRFDANGRWTVEEALLFSSSIDPSNVAFIEEPLSDPEAYEEYDQHVQIPFAFDESLTHRDFEDLQAYCKLEAIVLKPSLLGGPDTVREWADHAQKRGLQCVISAMYESGVGMRSLLGLAAMAPFHDVPAGLDTYSSLADDIAKPRLVLTSGSFISEGAWALDESKVTLVYDND